jgi:hypothetical protein
VTETVSGAQRADLYPFSIKKLGRAVYARSGARLLRATAAVAQLRWLVFGLGHIAIVSTVIYTSYVVKVKSARHAKQGLSSCSRVGHSLLSLRRTNSCTHHRPPLQPGPRCACLVGTGVCTGLASRRRRLATLREPAWVDAIRS